MIDAGLDPTYSPTGDLREVSGRLQERCGCGEASCFAFLIGDSRPGAQTLRVRSFVDTGVEPLKSTCIPTGRSMALDEPVVCVTWERFGGGTRFMRPTVGDGFSVAYKDPHVLYLSSISKWIMLLVRARIPPRSSATPNGCISDIVAFTADDAAFTEGVVGPFWVASSLAAYSEVRYRLFLGVPGGMEVTVGDVSYLYVYYVVEPADLTAFDLGLDEGTYPGREFPGGIAVRKIETSHFERTPLDEARWEETVDVESNVILHSSAARVRVWISADHAMYQVIPFESAFPAAHPVDPEPVPTGSGFTLFFAAISTRGAEWSTASGHGVWRASVLGSEGVSIDLDDIVHSVTVPSEFGVDWIIRGGDRTELGGVVLPLADHILPTRSWVRAILDPTAVRRADGYWELIVGAVDLSGASDESELLRLVGEDSDVNVSYLDAWT